MSIANLQKLLLPVFLMDLLTLVVGKVTLVVEKEELLPVVGGGKLSPVASYEGLLY